MQHGKHQVYENLTWYATVMGAPKAPSFDHRIGMDEAYPMVHRCVISLGAWVSRKEGRFHPPKDDILPCQKANITGKPLLWRP
jgi:hypothetical protein